MSDFRTKLLGIAALGIAMAGISSAQTITCGTNGANIIVGSQGVSSNPATLRLESQTELVQDITTTGISTGCTASAITNGSVVITLNGTVTSKSTGANGITDAAISINGGANIYGSILGTNQIIFNNVTFPTTFGFEIWNVRVNAATTTGTSVTESVNIQYVSTGSTTGSANLITGALQVGYIQPSLSFSLAAITGNGNAAGTFNSYVTCAGNPLPLAAVNNYLISTNGTPANTNLSFTVNIKELTPGAFKQQLSMGVTPPVAPAATAGGENGANINGSNGTASGPTTLILTLGNVPAAATVYLPLSVTSGNVTLTLLNSTALTGAQFQNGAANLPPPNSVGAVGNVVAFTPANGGFTATYGVAAISPIPSGTQTFPIPVEMIFAKNAAPAQTTGVSVLVSYAPSAATLTGAASAIPTFAASTATPIPASIISPCATTLLFPYVTNYQGQYETGLAISNTTTDNLGAAGASSATPTAGTCTLNFYGNQAQPTAVTTPSIGAWSTATGAPSPIYATTLTVATGATNFTGYAIAICNFLDAHGFAFIVDSSGTFSGTEGYLAVVVPNSRVNADSGAGTGNGQ